MCYINGVRVSLEEFIKYKREQKLIKELTAGKLFNQPAKRCFDYTEWPIIRVDGFGNWDAVPMEWGIIPVWVKDREEANQSRIMYPTYNAIGDELLNKRAYKNASKKYRCLVPSTGFYEYMHVHKIGKKGQQLKTTDRIPYRITISEEPIFYFAGIYSPWYDRERDEYINTFSICTTEAGPLMAQIHNVKKRQPTILTEELQELWLSKNLSDKEIVEIASYQYDNKKLRAYTVRQGMWNEEVPEMEVHYDNVPELVY